MQMPEKLFKRFGVHHWTISEDHFLQPGLLFDTMVDNEETSNVSKTGVFVCKLNVPTTAESFVENVKRLARGDRENMSYFKPLMMRRVLRWPEKNVFSVKTIAEGEKKKEKVTLKNRQNQFMTEFLNYDFNNPLPSLLEQTLETEGLDLASTSF
ncbi:Phospholipid-transporting ATPase DNF2 [Frankliniella fusca]|uniref:Phospholipid-transporting ATPase DNF2 n=1 Tax=Frankliniella fusca TaxID=407009 RepID=A0AAE1GTJ6_9NEOP|nr:Phospholipid-transporting ATPase DNF2 [Frankliniella fusca]